MHSIFSSNAVAGERIAGTWMYVQMGKIAAENIVDKMLVGEMVWNATAAFMENILRIKKRDLNAEAGRRAIENAA